MKLITLAVPDEKMPQLEKFVVEHDLQVTTQEIDIPLWQQVEVDKRMREALRKPEQLVSWKEALVTLRK